MGGGSSKEAQLDKLGHMFSPQEKKCLNSTFHIIAGYDEATFFSKEEFQVSLSSVAFVQLYTAVCNGLKRGYLSVLVSLCVMKSPSCYGPVLMG